MTGAHTENEHSYASPILYDFGGLTFLVTHGADFTIAYDLESGGNDGDWGG
jgi:outer membrane protein assembly factor BamB